MAYIVTFHSLDNTVAQSEVRLWKVTIRQLLFSFIAIIITQFRKI